MWMQLCGGLLELSFMYWKDSGMNVTQLMGSPCATQFMQLTAPCYPRILDSERQGTELSHTLTVATA